MEGLRLGPQLCHPPGLDEPSPGPLALTLEDGRVPSHHAPCPRARLTLRIHQEGQCGHLVPGQGPPLGLAVQAGPLQARSLCPWLGENPGSEGERSAPQGRTALALEGLSVGPTMFHHSDASTSEGSVASLPSTGPSTQQVQPGPSHI